MTIDNASVLQTATGDNLVRLIHEVPAAELFPILDNPAFDEISLALLLQRKDIGAGFLGEILKRRHFLKNYLVKKLLAFHPHTPRTDSLRLLRDLYLMDLVQFASSPGVLPDLKRRAEDHVVAKLPQLPLGQKITLARRSPARIAGALLADGQPAVVKAALANPNLTEAQLLRVLAKGKLPPVVAQSIARDAKWSHVYNVRIALIRQPSTTLTTTLAFLPELTVSDLRELASPGILPENLRGYLQAEIQRRSQKPPMQQPKPRSDDAPQERAKARASRLGNPAKGFHQVDGHRRHIRSQARTSLGASLRLPREPGYRVGLRSPSRQHPRYRSEEHTSE